MTADADAREVLSGRTLGEFRLLDRLDEGGFGAVYLARQDGLARPAVVKVLHQRAPAADASLQRFVREAQLASKVDHPYAVHVYAFGVEDDGLLWIAMELVTGVSLEEWLSARGPMPLEVFVPFFERVAQVVQAAHRRGIVHRDLKPSNIMVIEEAGELLPKLLDFGVAKLVDDITGRETSAPAVEPPNRGADDSLTPASWAIGCPPYMAPELWTDPLSAGASADIYALGVVAFEALTGRRPYRAGSARELGVRHCFDPVPPGPAALRRALAKRPEDRHDSALDLAAALRLESTREQRRRRARRLGTAATLAAVAIGVVAVQWRAMYEARIAQQRAAASEHEAHATALTAEVEQGRAALLHDDLVEAQRHLGAAWRGGDHTPATEFMYARALQPLRAELARLPATRGRMWSASWSPDGTQIVTTDDHGAQVWDAATYQPLSPLPSDDTVYSAVYRRDGTIVTAGGDGSVRIWNPATGDLVRELRLHGRAPRWRFAAVHDRLVAAVDTLGSVVAVWGATTGAVLAEFALDGSEWPSIGISADGRWIAAGGGDRAVVLDTATWRCVATIRGPQIRTIAWDPTGPRLITGSASGDAAIWSVPGGVRLRHLRELGAPIDVAAWSPDGTLVAAADRDGAVLVLNAAGKVVAQGNELHSKVMALAFSPDGSRLVSAGARGDVAVTDALSGLPITVLEGPTAVIRAARFSPDGRRVIAAAWDGTAQIWDASDPYRRWSSPPAADVGCGLVGGTGADGPVIAVACPGHPTRVWDTTRGLLLAELPALAPGAIVPFPAVSRAGDLVALARGATAELYAVPGGGLRRAIAHDATVTAVAIGARGELISGDADGAVLIDSVVAVPRAGTGIDALAVLSAGTIVAATARRGVQVVPGGKPIDVGIRAYMLRPAPDGTQLLVVPSYFGAAVAPVLVDTARAAIVARLAGPQVYSARWAGGGILTAHADGSARIWDTDGALRQVFRSPAPGLIEADMTPDGSLIVGAGGDGMLYFWDAASARALWAVQAHKRMALAVRAGPDGIVTRGSGGEVSRWNLPAPTAVIGASKISDRTP